MRDSTLDAMQNKGDGDAMISSCTALVEWLRARGEFHERGASLVEYALVVALIAVVCVLAVQVLGETTSTSLSSTASHVANAN